MSNLKLSEIIITLRQTETSAILRLCSANIALGPDSSGSMIYTSSS